MKTNFVNKFFGVVVLFLGCAGLNNSAQSQLTGNQSIGAYAPSYSSSRPEQQIKYASDPIRLVTNQVFNIEKSVLWSRHYGEPVEVVGAITIIQSGNGQYAKMKAVSNLTGNDVVAGKKITFQAMRTGKYIWNATPIELWDCGTPPRPPSNNPVVTAAKTNRVTVPASASISTNKPATPSAKRP